MTRPRLLHALIVAVAFAPAALVAQSGERKGDIPASFKVPPGMCRVWVDGVPAERQPAATDCATALKNKPTNGSVKFGDSKPVTGGGAPPVLMNRTLVPPAARGFTPPRSSSGARRDTVASVRDSAKPKRDTIVKKPPPR